MRKKYGKLAELVVKFEERLSWSRADPANFSFNMQEIKSDYLTSMVDL